MDFIIDLKDTNCRRCRESLISEPKILRRENGDCFCPKCAAERLNDYFYSYMNTFNDRCEAMLVLDYDTYQSTVKTLAANSESRRVKVFKGGIDQLALEDDAIIFVEIYDKKPRPYPLQRFMDEHYDLVKQCSLAQNSESTVTFRRSRNSGRKYLFYKTDSEEQTFESLSMAFNRLRVEARPDQTVYFQRCESDKYELAIRLLNDSGLNCVYCLNENGYSQERRSFTLDFTAADLYDYCRSRIIGQDDELEKAVYLVYDYAESLSAGREYNPPSWLLTAPSGMGKTEFYRAVRDFFKQHSVPIPVVQQDLSHISEYGYKGNNIDRIATAIYRDSQPQSGLPLGAGICFLDEADKVFIPSIGSSGTDHNAAVQANLLTLIEGAETDGKDSENDDITIDTNHTMFVLMGAFQKIRDKKRENGEAMRRIFSDDDELTDPEDCFYNDITIDDMIAQGMLEELAGRMALAINFHKLSKEDMRRLIIEKADSVGEECGVSIRLTGKAIEELMSIAYTNLGVRAPLNKLRELTYQVLASKMRTGTLDKRSTEVVITGRSSAHAKTKEKVRLAFGNN